MGKGHMAVAVGAALVLAGGTALAQGRSRYKPQPLNLQKEQLGSEGFANAGRARMRSGDCEGALEALDAALRTGIDPTLHRDRGLCHEKLGHPYPAMEDYRSYLTSAPDAPDADGIGERLRRLEDETRGSAPSSPSDESLGSGQANGSNASLAAGSNGVRASAAVGVGDKRDSIDSGDESLRTPLRRGQGWGFGPLFAEHKWFSSGSSFGDSQTWAECIGLQVRYSFGPVGALVVEVGYEHFNSTNIDLTVASGLTSQVAYELRLPLDPSYDDQIILAPGIGVEYLWSHPTDPQLATASSGVLVPRARLGYRHMILPAAGIDVSLDGGVATGSVPPLVSGPTASGGSSATAIVAINVAVVWGL